MRVSFPSRSLQRLHGEDPGSYPGNAMARLDPQGIDDGPFGQELIHIELGLMSWVYFPQQPRT